MGEVAEMMLDGTLCEKCGVALCGDSPGFPRYCSKQCAEDRGIIAVDNNDARMVESR